MAHSITPKTFVQCSNLFRIGDDVTHHGQDIFTPVIITLVNEYEDG